MVEGRDRKDGRGEVSRTLAAASVAQRTFNGFEWNRSRYAQGVKGLLPRQGETICISARMIAAYGLRE